MRIATIGLDIAKSVFQVHGVDAAGQVVVQRRLSRLRVLAFFEKLPPCLVGIEACSSSHYWARELIARGHEVRLMPAQYVKPYVKRGKNDAADAEAICEAVTRPTMRFVPVKTPEQQSVMMLHRVRLMLNRQRTQLSNSIRAHLSEFGIVAPIGRRGIDQLLAIVADENDARVPADARLCLQMLAAQLIVVKQQILENDRRVRASARATDLGRRLMDIPGRRPAARQRAYCNDLRSVRIQDRTRPLRLDRPGSQTELQRRKRTAWQYLQSRQPLFEADACGGRHGGNPLCRAAWNAPPLAPSAHAAALNKGRGGRTGKQDGAHDLGAHDKRRALSRTHGCQGGGRLGIGAARRL
jgi:transposase